MRLALALLGCLAAACAAPGPTVLPDPLARPKAAPPAATSAPVIGNPGFETDFVAGRACPPRWACSVHADGSSFRFAPDTSTASEGVRSLLLERVGREPWATVTQSFKAEGLRGQRVRFSIAVRAQGVDGEGAGAWLLLSGGGGVLDHQVRRVQQPGHGRSSSPSTWSPPDRPRSASSTTRNSAVVAKPMTMAVSTSDCGSGSL